MACDTVILKQNIHYADYLARIHTLEIDPIDGYNKTTVPISAPLRNIPIFTSSGQLGCM